MNGEMIACLITAFITPLYVKMMWIMRKLGQIEAKIDMINGGGKK